ncbi:hypothetical protein XENTR_v10020123 [Xenopus tropicalis]|uniref:TNF receptor-associated factor n=1 Tax=Xenopus tropicalis TaxID=8364 RepID=A0A6I8PZP6_XENTR|nr:TNF receptor-associated factor 1 isoform X2 [Xenopus tropicalis]KAE8582431.1 hypothetical protein XENTR_v10020123 [Xenopus tropicalis]
MPRTMFKLEANLSSVPVENEFVFGYPTTICDVAPGEKYLCCSCKNVLKKAQQTLCGHRYCTPCLVWIVRNHDLCPKCKAEDPTTLSDDSLLKEERAFSDAAINKEISELKVHCVIPGCTWRGLMRDYEEHESLCNYALIPCHTGCGHRVMRKQLADHLESECPNNTIKCPKCTQHFSSNEFPKHRCEKGPTDDQSHRKTDQSAKGKNGNSHSKKEKCHFTPLGCTYVGSREKIKEHYRTSAAAHLSLVCPLILRIKDNLTNTEGKKNGFYVPLADSTDGPGQKNPFSLQAEDFKAGNGDLELDCGHAVGQPSDEVANRLSLLETRLQVFENIISVLSKEIDSSQSQLAAIKEQKAEEERKVKALEHKVENLRCTLAMKDIVLNELEMRSACLEQTSYDGVFLWKISDLTNKSHDAVTGRAISLYSPAFYTAKYGYKVCLRIYLNGDGAGKGTHVSLFFTVMKGEYDALLPWPFKHKVTFVLVDHNNRDSVFDAFRPDVTSASFQRPINDMNVASGCPLFCPIAKLNSPKHAYIRENTLYIRCIIDTNS